MFIITVDSNEGSMVVGILKDIEIRFAGAGNLLWQRAVSRLGADELVRSLQFQWRSRNLVSQPRTLENPFETPFKEFYPARFTCTSKCPSETGRTRVLLNINSPVLIIGPSSVATFSLFSYAPSIVLRLQTVNFWLCCVILASLANINVALATAIETFFLRDFHATNVASIISYSYIPIATRE